MSVAEKQKLSEMLKSIHDFTGISVTVCDLDLNEVIACPAEPESFCRTVCRQGNENICCEGACQCCEACKRELTRQTMRCPAGLTEVVIPALDDEKLMGYIILGGFLAETDRGEFLRQAAAQYTEDRMVPVLAQQVPVCSEAAIGFVTTIADMVASYVVATGLFHPPERPLNQIILDYISQNLSADLSIQTLCRRFSVSKTELYRLLSRAAPGGVAGYIRQKRFAKACELLRGSRKSVWQIAEEVGYDNPDYFLRAFKKELGVSAGKYRKDAEHQSGPDGGTPM